MCKIICPLVTEAAICDNSHLFVRRLQINLLPLLPFSLNSQLSSLWLIQWMMTLIVALGTIVSSTPAENVLAVILVTIPAPATCLWHLYLWMLSRVHAICHISNPVSKILDFRTWNFKATVHLYNYCSMFLEIHSLVDNMFQSYHVRFHENRSRCLKFMAPLKAVPFFWTTRL